MAEGIQWCERNPEPVADGGGYRLSKEATILYGMANVVALGAKGIRINCTAPGVTDTPILDQLRTAFGQEFVESFQTPLGRVAAPDEQASVLVFLNSAAARYITGEVICVDGGAVAESFFGDGLGQAKGRTWPSLSDFRRVADDVRNWGRWGDADELGTLNLITAEKVHQAAGLVKHGKVFPLGVDFGSSGPQGAFHFRQNPLHVMTIDGGDASDAGRVRPWMAEEPGGDPAERVLDDRPDAVQRRRDHHAVAGGHPVGRAVARLLRGQAVQRVPGRLGHQPRRVPLRHRQGGRQGHHVARGAARHRAPARRARRSASSATRSRLPNSTRRRARRVSPSSAATSCWSGPVGGQGFWRPATAPSRAPAWTGPARRGCTTTRSPRSPPTT